jgi:hypothetical protein
VSVFDVAEDELIGKQTYIKPRTALSNYTFEPSHKLPSFTLFLFDVANPVFFSCTEDDLFRVCRHGIQQWRFAINV